MQFTIKSTEALKDISAEIIRLTETYTVFCFYGNLGAGKTTLIKQICADLGVTDAISSPTYPIINEYRCPAGAVYHIDLYRLKSTEEALNIGLEEYLYSGNPCFIEWPDNFESLLPDKHIKIFIRKLDDESRDVRLEIR